MNIHYNLTGERRKALVQAMSEILGEDAVYLGAPSFTYAVDGCTVSRDGTVSCPENIGQEAVSQLSAALQAQGFVPAGLAPTAFVVELPRTDFPEEACGNLRKIIASKAALLKKAIGTDTLDVEVTDETLRFPWFTLHGLDGEADAYIRLVTALCRMAKERKRVTAREREVTNDKFTMRLFLVRLGFTGDEYKAARRLLLRNLTGNSAWKSGRRPETVENSKEVLAAPAVETEGGAPYEK